MGTPATRITAEDFLTPPELARYRLAVTGAGRIGGVRLELVAAWPGHLPRPPDAPGSPATCLGACYQQVPLRVLPPFHFGPDQPALLYLLNPTAGLMDGDGQLVELTARAGTRAVVVGQSATRIHPSLSGFATQQWRLRVEARAVLVVLPGPSIPFRGCRYYQRVRVELDEGAGFVWGDVWLPGRYARGAESEWFQFTTLIQDLAVRRGGRLVFRDRGCWQGPWGREEAAWHFGDATAAGSLFVTGAVAEGLLPEVAGLRQAPLRTAAGDTCVRWCGTAEMVTARVVQTALAAARFLEDAGNRPWLTGADLAPAHWFSTGLQNGNPEDNA